MSGRFRTPLDWLFLALLGAGYVFLLSLYILPYYPFPSDDVMLRDGVDGKLSSRTVPIPVTIYIFRLFSHLLKSQTVISIGSTYDSMVVATIVINILTSLLLFHIVKKLRGGLFWPSLVAILYLSSEWTLLYVQFISHAPFLAFFFIGAVTKFWNWKLDVKGGVRKCDNTKRQYCQYGYKRYYSCFPLVIQKG